MKINVVDWILKDVLELIIQTNGWLESSEGKIWVRWA